MKVAVSACLWGERCRYDGTAREYERVKQHLEGCEVVLFCPEAPVLGTPRERISVVLKEGDAPCVIGDESGRDVTALLQEQTRQLIETHPDLDAAILKSKSPSCGMGTTPMVDGNGILVGYGNGIAATMLREHYPEIDIVDETMV